MSKSKAVSLWLFACCGMVFVASIIGAITRLTGSGLSITDWNPIMGALPPLDTAAWEKAFKGYQAIPQYQVLNRGMSLQEFKGIYFWEWLHRFWDRLIGIVFAVPFIWFLIKKQINRRMAWYLMAIFALGGLQGFVGWFMVQSGLAVRTSVSPYRLAIHLALALFLYALMLWAGMAIGAPETKKKKIAKDILTHGWIALGFVAVTMVWGAFTAGLHAGEAYNTWPLMDGEMLPSAAFTLNPAWINAFENLALVQFIHRWLGPATMLVILAWVARLWKTTKGHDQRWIVALGVMVFVQVGLGLATLLSHAEIALAVLHQAGAIMLLTVVLINIRRLHHR